MENKRKRVLLVSAAVILLCISIVAGMTWALFTDTQGVSNHLKAGDLNVTLKRVGLVKTTLNKDGYLETQPKNEEIIDFTGTSKDNVFDLGKTDGVVTEKIVPGSKFAADMMIINESDVAFGYWIEIVCTDLEKGQNLAKQLKVTVNAGTEASAFVGDGLTVMGATGGFIDEVAVGESSTFTVTVEFVDSADDNSGLKADDNDDAKGQELKFDLVVHAVQST